MLEKEVLRTSHPVIFQQGDHSSPTEQTAFLAKGRRVNEAFAAKKKGGRAASGEKAYRRSTFAGNEGLPPHVVSKKGIDHAWKRRDGPIHKGRIIRAN